MKKQLVIAFALGLVLPMGAMWLQEKQAPPEPEAEPQLRQQEWIKVWRDGSVVDLELEAYITGVVLSEMPADFQPEALKAQAVVARTYAMKRVQKGSKHEGAAVCTESSCCQGYRTPEEYRSAGGTEQAVERVMQAVADTAGIVLRYHGELIDATYFSCSGGSTEAAVEVWGTDVPYLQAVESPGEEIADHYTDRISFTTEEFAYLTGCSGKPEGWLGEIRYTQGGGVDTIELCGRIYDGTELRKLLGLRSTDFSLEIGTDTVTVTTQGFGHRVGMSQYGAEAMARAGSSFEEILTYYYSGAEVADVSD